MKHFKTKYSEEKHQYIDAFKMLFTVSVIVGFVITVIILSCIY